MSRPLLIPRLLIALVLATMLAGCPSSDDDPVAEAPVAGGEAGDSGSGSGGGDPRGDPGGDPGGEPPAVVTVDGDVTFDLVPSTPGFFGGSGLNYAATVAAPARGVTVEFVENGTVLESTSTDELGAFALMLPPNRTGFLRVRAEMVRTGTPSWDVRVVDNTGDDALYALEGQPFDTGAADSTRDLHAPSGWNASDSAYSEPRAAAPFAILDAVRDGMDLVLSAAPNLDFPPLVINWSVDNIPAPGESGGPDPDTGEILSSFYRSGPNGGIFLLGAEDVDTEEYDRHVILHEWAHYLEAQFSRSDSIGGPHAMNDLVDMRVAFGEGWATAFAGLAAGDSVYRDTQGPNQASSGGFNIEGPGFIEPDNAAPGWFSEQSMQEIIYDLVDVADDGADTITLEFAALFDVFTGSYRDTTALTSVFPFVHALKLANPEAALQIDALLADQSIETISDEYGSGEDNDAGSADVLPIYADLVVGGPAVNICSTDEFESRITGLENKLGTRRFLSLSLSTPSRLTVTATATDIPEGSFADPDFIMHSAGPVLIANDAPTEACEDIENPDWEPADCEETFTTSLFTALPSADYVLEVYEWTNTQSAADDFPPIGRTCFDVEVTEP